MEDQQLADTVNQAESIWGNALGLHVDFQVAGVSVNKVDRRVWAALYERAHQRGLPTLYEPDAEGWPVLVKEKAC